jgi:hypothetical protein
MSMVYDPVTREFRPREARGVKPVTGSGDLASPQTETEGGGHRPRRWQGVRRLRRQREMLFWLLVVIIAGALVWCTLLISKSMQPRYPLPEKPIIDRFWSKAND